MLRITPVSLTKTKRKNVIYIQRLIGWCSLKVKHRKRQHCSENRFCNVNNRVLVDKMFFQRKQAAELENYIALHTIHICLGVVKKKRREVTLATPEHVDRFNRSVFPPVALHGDHNLGALHNYENIYLRTEVNGSQGENLRPPPSSEKKRRVFY